MSGSAGSPLTHTRLFASTDWNRTEGGDRPRQHIAHRGTVDLRRSRARGLAGSSEQTDSGHVVHRSGVAVGSAATLATMTTASASGRNGGPASVASVTRLLALRHGESEWNAGGRWQEIGRASCRERVYSSV